MMHENAILQKEPKEKEKRKRKMKDLDITNHRKRSRNDSNAIEQNVGTMDRISELPVPIIHEVLKFLQTKDAARTTVLSKRWKHAWQSFPILDFDQRMCIRKRSDVLSSRKKFKKFVDYSLKNRLKNIYTIEKFKLNIISYESNLAPHVDRWIKIATDRNLKGLDIHVKTDQDEVYNLPPTVFTVKTITSLKLCGCKLGIRNIQLLNLQKLSLEKLVISEEIIQILILGCPLLVDLRLVSCQGLRSLEVSSLHKLNRVDLHLCHGLEQVNIAAPNLQAFWFCHHRYRKGEHCEINLADCISLKRLTLEDPKMTTESFHSFIVNFPILEHLILSKCSSLESIDLLDKPLKNLVLRGCKNLVDVKIDAPKLLSLEYDGDKWPFAALNALCLREAKLSFKFKSRDTIIITKLGGFLATFGQSRDLKLVVRSRKNVLIHEDMGEIVLPPVGDLKIEIIKPSTSLDNLLESVLRTHLPVTLSIVSPSHSKFIKLVRDKLMDREKKPNCCRYYSKKCWRHYLKGVEVENFEGLKDENSEGATAVEIENSEDAEDENSEAAAAAVEIENSEAVEDKNSEGAAAVEVENSEADVKDYECDQVKDHESDELDTSSFSWNDCLTGVIRFMESRCISSYRLNWKNRK